MMLAALKLSIGIIIQGYVIEQNTIKPFHLLSFFLTFIVHFLLSED